jgi:hypothetical protein
MNWSMVHAVNSQVIYHPTPQQKLKMGSGCLLVCRLSIEKKIKLNYDSWYLIFKIVWSIYPQKFIKITLKCVFSLRTCFRNTYCFSIAFLIIKILLSHSLDNIPWKYVYSRQRPFNSRPQGILCRFINVLGKSRSYSVPAMSWRLYN